MQAFSLRVRRGGKPAPPRLIFVINSLSGWRERETKLLLLERKTIEKKKRGGGNRGTPLKSLSAPRGEEKKSRDVFHRQRKEGGKKRKFGWFCPSRPTRKEKEKKGRETIV